MLSLRALGQPLADSRYYYEHQKWFDMARSLRNDESKYTDKERCMFQALYAEKFSTHEDAIFKWQRYYNIYEKQISLLGKYNIINYITSHYKCLGEYKNAATSIYDFLTKYKKKLTHNQNHKLSQLLDLYTKLCDISKPSIIKSISSDTIALSCNNREFIDNIDIPIMIADKQIVANYDTGSSISAISDSLASLCNISIITNSNNIKGIGGNIKGHYAIADDICIGNSLIHNILFLVLPQEVFRELNSPECIIGNNVGDLLEEVQLDLKNKQLIIPHVQKIRSADKLPNLYRDSGGGYVAECIIDNDTINMYLDTGSTYSSLTHEYYKKNIMKFQNSHPTKRCIAGIAGETIYYCYSMEYTLIKVGGNACLIDHINVPKTKLDSDEAGGRLGMNFFKNIDFASINTKQMYLEVFPIKQ